VQTFERRSIDGETRVTGTCGRCSLGEHHRRQDRALHDRQPVPPGRAPPVPDLPSNRYAEIAVHVKALFEKYGLSYTTGSLPRQVLSAWKKVFRLRSPTASAARHGPTHERTVTAGSAHTSADRRGEQARGVRLRRPRPPRW